MLPNWSLCLHPLLLQYMLYTIALQCLISYRVKAKVLPMVYRVLHDLLVFCSSLAGFLLCPLLLTLFHHVGFLTSRSTFQALMSWPLYPLCSHTSFKSLIIILQMRPTLTSTQLAIYIMANKPYHILSFPIAPNI